MTAYPLYGGPASFGSYSGFVATQGYLLTGPVAYDPPTATLIGQPFEIDLLGKGAAARKNNVWVWVYNFFFADSFIGFASPALAVEHEYLTFLAATTGTNVDGTSKQTGTLAVYLADLSTTVSAPARLVDATVTSDKRFFGNLEISLSFRLFANLA